MIDSTLRTCPCFPRHLSSPHEQYTMWNHLCQSENRPLIDTQRNCEYGESPSGIVCSFFKKAEYRNHSVGSSISRSPCAPCSQSRQSLNSSRKALIWGRYSSVGLTSLIPFTLLTSASLHSQMQVYYALPIQTTIKPLLPW